MCSASRCVKCESVIYDEELIAGWTVEKNSNLTCSCIYCGFSFLPSLRVTIRRKSNELSSSWYVPLSISIPDANKENNISVDDENAVTF